MWEELSIEVWEELMGAGVWEELSIEGSMDVGGVNY